MIEKNLELLHQCVGGEKNIVKVYDKNKFIYIYVKDASIVNLSKLKENSDFDSAELNGSRLVLSRKGEDRKSVV